MNGLTSGGGLRNRAAIGALTVCAAVWLAGPGAASGSTAIGSNFAASFSCSGPATYFQESTGSGSPSYEVPAGGGVITSWSTQQGATSARIKLGILHPTGAPSQFMTTAASAVETVGTYGSSTFNTRLSAQAGDTIAVLIVSGAYQCASFTFALGDIGQRDSAAVHDTGTTFTYGDPDPGTRINIAATVEADADADGYGDETQDLCPSDAGRQTECDPPETEITKEPKNRISKHTAKYKFTANEPGSSFECKYDRKPYKPCTSPLTVRAKEGKHKFKVRAIDQAGNVDPTPEKDKFRVV